MTLRCVTQTITTTRVRALRRTACNIRRKLFRVLINAPCAEEIVETRKRSLTAEGRESRKLDDEFTSGVGRPGDGGPTRLSGPEAGDNEVTRARGRRGYRVSAPRILGALGERLVPRNHATPLRFLICKRVCSVLFIFPSVLFNLMFGLQQFSCYSITSFSLQLLT